jgi:hypothetical protein
MGPFAEPSIVSSSLQVEELIQVKPCIVAQAGRDVQSVFLHKRDKRIKTGAFGFRGLAAAAAAALPMVHFGGCSRDCRYLMAQLWQYWQ